MLHLPYSFKFARQLPHPAVGRHENRRMSLAAMTLSSGVTSIPTSLVVAAIAHIHKDFNASQGELQWIIVGFSLSYSALLVLAGRLSDVYGRRRFFLAGTVVYAAATIGATIAPDALVLIIMVVLMGAGAAILTPASLSIITDAFAPAERATAIGIWAAASAFISAAGPAFGGILANWDWRSVFWINLPFVALFLVLALRATRESKDPNADSHVDVLGLVTLAGGLTALLLVLNEGQSWGYASLQSIILFIAAGVLFAVFVVAEPRVRNALVDFGFFRKRNFLGGNAALLVVNFGLAAVLFFMLQYMQEVLNYSSTKAGLLSLPLSATMVVALPAGGPIAERVGPRIPIVIGLALTAAGCYLLTYINADSGYNDVWPGMLFAGAGVGLALTPLNTAAMNAIRRTEHGAAAGVLVTMSGIGAALGVALSGTFFQSVLDTKSDSLLGKLNPAIHLTDAQERTLSGLLTGSKPALAELHRFDPAQQGSIRHALRQGYTDGLGVVMWLALGITVAGLVLVALVMQRSAAMPDEEDVLEVEAQEARA